MPNFRAALSRKPGLPPAALLSSEAIGARLEDLERKVERLRALYESFFLGVERRPPQMPRQELNRLMLEAQQLSVRNAALRFRLQALSQRWTLLTTYWNRTLREIETGTYRRDLQKAYRRIAARGEPLTEQEAAALGIPLSRAKAFVAQQNRRVAEAAPSPAAPPRSPQTAPAQPADAEQATAAATDITPSLPSASASALPAPSPSPSPSPSPPAASAGPLMAESGVDLLDLQRAYREAHMALGLSGTPPTAEQLGAKVLPYVRKLQATHSCMQVDVTVVVQNGRLTIRARPKRG